VKVQVTLMLMNEQSM